jgi:NitT/TauT family transport system permease protein
MSGKFVKKEAFWIGGLSICLMMGLYWYFAWDRNLINPDDKLLPLPVELWGALLKSLTPEPDGDIPLVVDTIASLARLIFGLVSAVTLALAITLLSYVSSRFRYFVEPLVHLFAKVPPVALLPVLLLWLGLNENSRTALMILGLAPSIALSLTYQLQKDSVKLSDKLASLQLPRWQQIYFIHLPMLWPSFLQTIQINLGAAWLFLLIGETFGAESGLGYRIFVVKRFLAMDTILVYVAWITLLSTLLYLALDWFRKQYSWVGH